MTKFQTVVNALRGAHTPTVDELESNWQKFYSEWSWAKLPNEILKKIWGYAYSENMGDSEINELIQEEIEIMEDREPCLS